ncbi:MAG: pyrimidine reductase family protein [Actinobacteria bacterium]|nr:pyrimidine reductase family protein [Actinomycetota bacterium]
MRQLFPRRLDDVDPIEVYAVERKPRDDRPWVLANMVASVDGAATSQGRSGSLSTPGDRQIFHILRGLADVILVGAGTVRAEGYGPAKGPDAATIAVVSGRLDLDWASPLFVDATTRPCILTCEAAGERLTADASAVANVVVAGREQVDLARALQVLRQRGTDVVLCEGGPALLGQLVELDLVDELCLTISPMLVGDQGPRILTAMSPQRRAAEPLTILEEDGCLFLRYRVGPNIETPSDVEGGWERSLR